MRGALLALCCVLPAAAAARDPTPIEAGDWTFVGNSAVTVMFIKPQTPPAGSAWRRILVRFEELTPFDRAAFASMSSVEVDDVDCAGQRTRVIRNTRYAERNMTGESRIDTVDMPVWKSEAKGSFGAGILKAVCGEVL